MTTSITHEPIFVADLDLLTPGLAVGGDLHPNLVQAAGQVRFLQSIGITDIIDCREEHSDEQLVAEVASSIQYHHLPTDDHGGELHPRWWKQGVDIARDAADRGGRVFVHCHMGVNRGPSLALAILIDRGMDAVEAFRLLRARRPQAHAIYAPQYLTLLGKEIETFALEQEMRATYDDDDLIATIGRIRRAEAEGYRFSLADDRPSIDVELKWGLRAFFHIMFAEGRRLQELGHHLIVRLVPWDDDDYQLRLSWPNGRPHFLKLPSIAIHGLDHEELRDLAAPEWLRFNLDTVNGFVGTFNNWEGAPSIVPETVDNEVVEFLVTVLKRLGFDSVEDVEILTATTKVDPGFESGCAFDQAFPPAVRVEVGPGEDPFQQLWCAADMSTLP